MYYLNAPSPEAIRYYWILGAILLLVVAATFLRPFYRHFPMERRLWLAGAFIYSFIVTVVGADDTVDLPGILLFGRVMWCVVGFAFLNGCFRRLEPDSHPVRARAEDVILALACWGIVFGYILQDGVSYPREAARSSQCRNNLKDLALAFHNILGNTGRFPAATHGDPPQSWRVDLLPYIDQGSVFVRYDSTAAWDAPINHPVAATAIHSYMCPSRARAGPSGMMDGQHRYYSQYVMLTGPDTASNGASIADFADGTSNTILVAEACGLNRVWTEPHGADTTSLPAGINLPSPTRNLSPGWISSHHRGGAHVALADGSTRFLSETIDPRVLQALSTIDRGEQVDPE